MTIVFWNQSHLWRDRKELSEINLLDMWFCSFFITYQRKQARQSRIAVVPVSEKSWSRTDGPVFLTFEKPLCKDIHGPGPVHTHHLPQGVAPARVRCPAGGRQTFIYFFSLKAPVVFFFCTGVFTLTRLLLRVLNQNPEENEAQKTDPFFWSVMTKRKKKHWERGTLRLDASEKPLHVQIKVTTSFRALLTAT